MKKSSKAMTYLLPSCCAGAVSLMVTDALWLQFLLVALCLSLLVAGIVTMVREGKTDA